MSTRHRSSDDPRDSGLGTMIRRLGGLFNVLSDLSENMEQMDRTGEIKDPEKGLHAVYGFSVRVGGKKPSIQPFGNVREGREGAVVDETREPLIDVFDESDHVLVVAELPGVNAGDVRIEVKDDILNLSASRGDRKYRKEILLPFAVAEDSAAPSFQNGIYELRLARRK